MNAKCVRPVTADRLNIELIPDIVRAFWHIFTVKLLFFPHWLEIT